jgi:hypothetical protein
MGCSHETVRNYLSLIDLPDSIQDLVEDENLSMTAALAVEREVERLIQKAEAQSIELEEEEQEKLKQSAWDDVRRRLKQGKSLSGSEASKLVHTHVPEDKKSDLLEAAKKKEKQEKKEQEKVGPEHGGQSVLECRLPKKDLLDVLGTQLQDEEKVDLTFSSEKLIGPAGEVSLEIASTMQGTVSLHSSYAHALSLIVECPDTKGSEITLTMSKNSPSLQITSSGAAALDCRLPAHLDTDMDHPEVYGAEDVQACIPSQEEKGVLVFGGFSPKTEVAMVGGGQ